MLHRRLLSAAVLIAVALILIGMDLRYPVYGQPGIWMTPLYFFFTLATAFEIAQLLGKRWPISIGLVLLHCTFSCLVSLYPLWYSLMMGKVYPLDCPVGRLGWVLIGVLSGVGTSGLHTLWLFQSESQKGVNVDSLSYRTSIERTLLVWVVSSFIVTYTVGCLSFWFLVRMHGNSTSGMLQLIALLAIVKFADAGAYFAGKAFGRHKLVPAISPGKTIEGLVGGMLLSIMVAYVFFRLILPGFQVLATGPFWGPAILGCLLTLVGLVGDLLESMVKRTVGAKDSGALLPGLGGVWDVTDSLLPAAIVGYLGIIAKLT